MANRDTTSYTHGAQGNWPSSSKDFAAGDPLPEDELDKLFYYLVTKSKDFADEFDRLDSDNDGIVDEADAAQAASGDFELDGDLKATDGELVWDEASGYVPETQVQNSDKADTVDGRDAAELVGYDVASPVTNYGSGLTDEEVWRIDLDAGEQLEVWRLECQLKGGGTNSNVAVDLYDVANNTSLVGDVTAGSKTYGSPITTSSGGATVVLRLTNGASSSKDVSYTLKANIRR